jgi:lipoprotein-anchoring transpeptidase ErfK/SrfK
MLGPIALLTFFLLLTEVAEAKNFGKTLCKDNQETEYVCHSVKRGETWEKLFPDENRRDLVKRINRMNTKLYKGLKIAIPKSDDNDPLKHSPMPVTIDPPGVNTIIISISNLAFGAYDAQGSLQKWGPISAGKSYCSDVKRRCTTPTGKYAIYSKKGRGCVSSKFPVGRGGAPMPYCMFFHRGFAMHGSYIVPGYNDSHGCVRTFVNDAEWLNQDFAYGHTKVIVKN